MSDDFELLQQFVRERSDAAFEALSKRHAGLVYSAALRQTGDPHMAEDVTQAVFAVLARFVQRCQFDEVGSKLGVSTDAAKKRIERALEKLRRFFSKKGVSVGAVALGALLTGNAVQAAPAALVAGLGAAPVGTALI